MSALKKFKEIEKRHAWSFFGFVLAVALGSLALYDRFFIDKKPNLLFTVESATDVLDLREQISNLKILFNGSDIREERKELRIISVRIQNDSSKDILQSYYDTMSPIGMKISSGEIIRADVATTSNLYLNNRFNISLVSEKTLQFSNPIIEAGQWIVIDVLVLYPKGTVPEISPIGKVAGIKNIEINKYVDETGESFLSDVFDGSFYVQLSRLIPYTVGFLVFIFCSSVVVIIIMLPFVFISEWLGEKRRGKIVTCVYKAGWFGCP